MKNDTAAQPAAWREWRSAASSRRHKVGADPVVRRAVLAGATWLVGYGIATPFVAGSERGEKMLGDVLFLVPVVAAAILTWMAASRVGGRHRRLWRVMAVSNLCWLGGELTWSYYEIFLHQESPFPSAADVFYLASVALVLPAIVLGFRSGVRTKVWRGMLDVSVAMIAVAVTGFRFLIMPQLSDGWSLSTVTSIAYPALDVAVLMLLCSMAFSGNRHVPRSVVLIGLAFAVTAITDGVYTYLATVNEYATGGWLDIGWEIEAVLMCVAALVALRRRELDAIAHENNRDVGLPLIIGGAAVGFGIMMWDATDGNLPLSSALLGCAAVIGMVARLVLTAREKASVAVRLKRALHEQERLAVTDGLTGLHNRRFFEAVLPIESQRAVRAKTHMGVLVLDVDLFKSVNDEHGHQAGDAVLVELADRIKRTSRPTDVVARYGGEEFVILLPGADAEVLLEVAERLRRTVSETAFVLPDGAARSVTMSVGGACIPEHATTPEELIKAADRAMYGAKDRGRNQVIIGEVSMADHDAPVHNDDDLMILERVADEIDALLSESPHSRVMAAWTATIAEALGLDPITTRRAMIAARLHDVGKLVVPNHVLSKPGPLSAEEWEEVRRHPTEGRRLVGLSPHRKTIAAVVEQHHERFDGRGYPNQLSGEDIMIEARIVSVCDAWAAMRADRPYRAALSVDDARAQLRLGSGTQFDQSVVGAFLALETRGLVGAMPTVQRDDVPHTA
jgi:two-component system, cell cycle response regulator